ncbi:MAG TPA: hypothetical protein VHT51_14430 [Micropepsaceae bacterium]|jgi:hypothetical protein|nr:hypothetical protein [Micropepsaceae bacterium]
MKHRARIAALGATLIAAPLPAVWADEGAQYMVLNTGRVSCGSWNQFRGAAKQDKYDVRSVQAEEWVSGYITAVNAQLLPTDRGAARNLIEQTDSEGVFAWIDSYCAAHALLPLSEAASALVSELSAKWLAAHPPRK